jgi:hypothetical protein
MKIVIERPDGGVSIMTVYDLDTTAEAEVAKWEGTNGPATGYHVAGPGDVPTDRAFRDAWKVDEGLVAVDMPRAREIQRGKMRAAREPLLKALDVEADRALETGNTADVAVVAAKKQALRDVTAHPAIDAAQTPAALKSVWPTALGVEPKRA